MKRKPNKQSQTNKAKKHTHKGIQYKSMKTKQKTDTESILYRLWNIIEYLRSINYKYQPLQIFLENESTNTAFEVLFLIHERTESVMNYNEFLTFIAKNVLNTNNNSETNTTDTNVSR